MYTSLEHWIRAEAQSHSTGTWVGWGGVGGGVVLTWSTAVPHMCMHTHTAHAPVTQLCTTDLHQQITCSAELCCSAVLWVMMSLTDDIIPVLRADWASAHLWNVLSVGL